VILKGFVAFTIARIKLMTDILRQYGNCHGLILLSALFSLLRHMMDESLFGRRSVLDSHLEVGVSCKMDGRGSRSILCTLLVVSASCDSCVVPADFVSKLYRMGTL
jgi:hypothetical protein